MNTNAPSPDLPQNPRAGNPPVTVDLGIGIMQISLQGLVDLYCEHRVLSEESCRSLRSSARRFERFLPPEVASDIRLITRDMFLKFRAELLKTVRPTSFNTYRLHVHIMFRLAKEEGWCDSNPLERVGNVSVPLRRKKVLETDTYVRILDYLTSRQPVDPGASFWISVTKTLYYTGMRRRQLAALQWRDVCLSKGTVLLRAESSKTRREWTIPLSDEVISALSWLRQHSIEVLGRVESDGHVFNPKVYGNQRLKRDCLSAREVTVYFVRLGHELGTAISPHRFRHTFASHLSNSGTNLRVVQEFLGHASIATTSEYVEPDISAMRSALACLDKGDRETT